MTRFLLALALALTPTLAWAQCNGVFPALTACGSVAGGIPGAIPFTSIGPAGTSGQVQFNNSGVFGGFTLSGACTLNTTTGVITCTSSSILGPTFGAL